MEVKPRNGRIIPTISKSYPVMVLPDKIIHEGFYFLSNLDQNIAVIVQTVYCFKGDEKKSGEYAVEAIKRALGRVLVHYYPLAGSLAISSDGKLVVKCTNKGVLFVEAEADCDMVVLGDISVPDPAVLGELVYTIPGAKHILEIPLITVQVTKFKCGGFVVGMALNHCMADGIAATHFVNSWAEAARSMSLATPPVLDRSILKSRPSPTVGYLHNEFTEIPDTSNMSNLYEQEELTYHSFPFGSENLSKLKKLATEDGKVTACSTFVVLTALVWRARTKALKMKPDQQTKLLFAVDGRSKLDRALPKGYFGNGIVLTCCLTTAGELTETPLSFAVGLVQDAIKMVNKEFILSAIDYFETTRARPSLNATLLVTSWTRLDFDSTDFGWGVPVQTGCANLPEKEVALLLSHGTEKKTTTLLLGLPVSAMKTFKKLMQV